MPKTAQGEVTEGTAAPSSAEDQLVREGDIAGDYLERLLDLLDYDGDIDLDVEAGRAVVSIDGGEDLTKLVGDRGAVLEALQELTRLAVQQSSGNRSRLMLDIAGWRQARREELTELGSRTAKSVLETGESAKLRPMTPFERKVVHDAVARIRGVVQRERGRGTAAPGRDLPRCLTAVRCRWRPTPCSGTGRHSLAASPSTWSPPGSSAACSGPREAPRVWDRHVLNCAVVAELVPDGARVVDVGSAALGAADAEQHDDGVGREPACGEHQSVRGRGVREVQVVHHDRDRALLGVPADQAQHRGTDREPVPRIGCRGRAGQRERRGEGIGLDRRDAVERAERRAQQLQQHRRTGSRARTPGRSPAARAFRRARRRRPRAARSCRPRPRR